MAQNQELFMQLLKEFEVSFYSMQSPSVCCAYSFYHRATIRQLVCTLVSLNGIQSWVMDLLEARLRNSGNIIYTLFIIINNFIYV